MITNKNKLKYLISIIFRCISEAKNDAMSAITLYLDLNHLEYFVNYFLRKYNTVTSSDIFQYEDTEVLPKNINNETNYGDTSTILTTLIEMNNEDSEELPEILITETNFDETNTILTTSIEMNNEDTENNTEIVPAVTNKGKRGSFTVIIPTAVVLIIILVTSVLGYCYKYKSNYLLSYLKNNKYNEINNFLKILLIILKENICIILVYVSSLSFWGMMDMQSSIC